MRAFLLILALAACSGKKLASEPAHSEPATAVEVARPLPATDAPSLYDLGVALRDANGRTIGLDVARGKPVLLSMFYGSCNVACPVLIDDLKRTVAASGRTDVEVVLVSIDPARDTPEKLASLVRAHRLDARWTLAAPADDNIVRELAAAIGYKYRKLDSGEFFHSATVVLLDEQGRPVARSETFSQREPLLAALR